jgi:hypothetical protein
MSQSSHYLVFSNDYAFTTFISSLQSYMINVSSFKRRLALESASMDEEARNDLMRMEKSLILLLGQNLGMRSCGQQHDYKPTVVLGAD